MLTTPRESRALHQINLADAGDQQDPVIADIGLGRYIVVWTELAGGPVGFFPGNDLVGQIFDAAGNRFGSEFVLNTSHALEDEQNAAIASRPNGGFVMVYEEADPGGTSIHVETRDVNGALVSGMPTTIRVDPGNDVLSNPAIAILPTTVFSGEYLVIYNRLIFADGTVDLYGRIVDASGAMGGEFPFKDSPDSARNADIASLTNTNWVIVFEDADDGTLADFDPVFQLWTEGGGFLTEAAIDTGANMQTDVHVAALTGGGFVAVWTEANIDGSGTGIRARIYNNTGTPLAAAFTVNTFTTGNQNEPDVTALNDGGFVVTWDEDQTDLLAARRFNAVGTAVGGGDWPAGNSGSETQPTIATLSDGRFVIAYQQTTGDDDIQATIFAVDTKTDDFNYDVRSDILWRHDSGDVATWDMNGGEILGTRIFTGAPRDWHLQGTADFNGDGRSDLLWRQDGGLLGTWHMSGSTVLSTHTFSNAPPEWHVRGTGDFNGDNQGDILWRHDGGTVGIWHMNGTNILSTPAFTGAPLDWHIEGTGDFNGDGRSDILWRHDSGLVGIWHMNGAAVLSTPTFTGAPLDWHIEGTGDFNGDGRDDLLLRHDDGTVGTWHMDGATVLSTQVFTGAPNTWHIEGTGDYNGDSRDDILWRSDDGTVGIWHLNGAALLSSPVFGGTPNEWQILGNQFDLI